MFVQLKGEAMPKIKTSFLVFSRLQANFQSDICLFCVVLQQKKQGKALRWLFLFSLSGFSSGLKLFDGLMLFEIAVRHY
jgi:hypothetical protein